MDEERTFTELRNLGWQRLEPYRKGVPDTEISAMLRGYDKETAERLVSAALLNCYMDPLGEI